MIPASHPDEETMLAYVVGGLPPGSALVVHLHLEYCAHCRQTVRFLDLLGGALMSELPPEPMAPMALERALEAASGQPAETPALTRSPSSRAIRVLRHGSWMPLAPGVELAAIEGDFDADETVCMLRGKAGSIIGPHGHEIVERFVVLEGAFGLDETIHPAGDYIEADASVIHAPFVPKTSDCLCLFALQGKLVFPEKTPPAP